MWPRVLGDEGVLRTSAAPYLVVALGTEILVQGLGAFTQTFVLPPDAPGHRILYLAGMLTAWGLWILYRESDRPPLLRGLLVLMLALWALALWRGLEDPQALQANSFTLPLLLVMVWIKPPAAADGRRVVDAVSWIFVGMFVVWLGLEVVGVLDSWYGDSTAGQQAALADRAFYVLPLAELLGLDGRWAGPFLHPNSAGPVGAFLLVVALCRRAWGRWVFLFSGLTILVLTGSRTSAVAALFGVVAVVIATWLCHKSTTTGDRIAMTVTPIALIGLLAAAANRSLVSVASDASLAGQLWEANGSMTGRTSMWPAYWNLWLESPLFGVSKGVIAEAVEAGIIPMWAENSAHNAVLDALARTGIVGAVLLAATAFLAGWLAVRAARDGEAVPLGVFAILAAGAASEALVSWLWASPSTILLLLVAIGSVGTRPAPPPVLPQKAGAMTNTED